MKNKKFLIVIVGVLISLAILGAILERTHIINLHNKSAGPAQAPTSSQGPTAQQKQKESETNADNKKQVVEEKAPDNNSTPGNNVPVKSVDLSARKESNNTVTVFTKLTGYSSGTCDMSVTNANKTNSQSAPVIYQPEFSTCAGFSIPVSTLGVGTWTIKLAVNSQGATESKTLSFEVK